MDIQVKPGATDQHKCFVTSKAISSREAIYKDSQDALASPIAGKIFGFSWAAEVRVGTDFVEVLKQDWVSWDVLEEPLRGMIEEHFSQATDPIEENPIQDPPKVADALSSDEGKIIQQLIEEQINPALANHGGFVVLHDVKDNRVFLEMGGGCQGCAMSYQTMKEGIETSIKEVLPDIIEVIDVTNHAAGDNPYYSGDSPGA